MGCKPSEEPKSLAEVLRLLGREDRQKLVARGIMATDRMKRVDAELLGRAVGAELGLKGLEEEVPFIMDVSLHDFYS